MLWELSVTEQRYRAVLEILAGVPVTEVAERYGVSRQSAHAWLRRYRDEGPSGLADRSHRVDHHPCQIEAEVESAVCELRRAHPKWGPKRLVFEMDRRGHGTVTRSTVYRVLVRNGLIEPKSRKRRRQDYRRWERPVPMQLWQLDVTASAFLADGREVKIVTGIDDHSRYCVIAKAVLRATARPVCQAFLDIEPVHFDAALARPILLEWLPRVSNERVREAMVRHLAIKTKDGQTAHAMIREYRRPGSASYKWVVASTLAYVCDKRHFATITDLAAADSQGIGRQPLVAMLWRVKSPAADQILLKALTDPDTALVAMTALRRRFGNAEASQHITPLLDDPEERVRWAASQQLKRIGRTRPTSL
jgi:transposase